MSVDRYLERPLRTQSSTEPVDSISCRKSLDETPNRFNKASPFGQLLDVLRTEVGLLGLWDDQLHRDLPKRWEKHGDLIIFPHNSFRHKNWRLMGPRLWQTVAKSLNANRLGRKRIIDGDEYHSAYVDLLFGNDGWVEHVDNEIIFHYDVTKCLFNTENAVEKQRISRLDCHQEVVVDMFAGIGYYTLPYLVSAHAKYVYAVDWDEDVISALKKGLDSNQVNDRCTVITGDSRRVSPRGVADRVNLGLVPSSRPYWLSACRCLKSTGGILHVHEVLKQHSRNSPNSITKKAYNNQTNKRKISRNESLISVSEESGSGDLTDSGVNLDVELSDVTGNEENKQIDNSTERTTTDAKPVNGEVKLVRKMSRSASIIEELENLTLPSVRIDEALKEERWLTLSNEVREFAVDCAQNCTRYLNNIHDDRGKLWACTLTAVTKVKTFASGAEHFVIDVLCRAEDAKANCDRHD